MDIDILAFLIGAGIAGGIVNALAGGATLLTFPAMLFAGLGPVVANASSTVALTPGYLMAAFADREARPPADRRLWTALAAALTGGGLGAVLLLVTPDEVFVILVPLLVAAGTLLYAFSDPIERLIDRRLEVGNATLRPVALVPACIYGGYFGAGLGVMLLGALRTTGGEGLRGVTALKNLLSSAVRAVAVVIFTVAGSVSWPETAVMTLGALAGGFLGGTLVKALPSAAVYWAVVGIGAAMTVYYGRQYWS